MDKLFGNKRTIIIVVSTMVIFGLIVAAALRTDSEGSGTTRTLYMTATPNYVLESNAEQNKQNITQAAANLQLMQTQQAMDATQSWTTERAVLRATYAYVWLKQTQVSIQATSNEIAIQQDREISNNHRFSLLLDIGLAIVVATVVIFIGGYLFITMYRQWIAVRADSIIDIGKHPVMITYNSVMPLMPIVSPDTMALPVPEGSAGGGDDRPISLGVDGKRFMQRENGTPVNVVVELNPIESKAMELLKLTQKKCGKDCGYLLGFRDCEWAAEEWTRVIEAMKAAELVVTSQGRPKEGAPSNTMLTHNRTVTDVQDGIIRGLIKIGEKDDES